MAEEQTVAGPSPSASGRGQGHALLALLLGLATFGCGPGDEFRFIGGDGVVRGTILDGGNPNAPVGQARVSLLGVASASTSTRQDGLFELRDVRPGLYDLVADRTIGTEDRRVRLRFIEVVADQTLDLPDLTLDLPGSVQGSAVLTGSGVGNPVAPDNSGINVSLIGTTLRTITDAAGNWAISPVEIGSYAIRFDKEQFVAQVVHDVSVARAATTTVPLVILDRLEPPRRGTLRGRVLLESADGGDASGVTVRVDGTVRSLVTTPGGSWAFDDLPVGVYQIAFTHPDYFEGRLQDQQIRSGFPLTTAPDLTLSNHKVLDPTLQVSGLSEAPSGNQLAFLTLGGNASEVGLLAPDGQGFRQIITSGANAAAGRGLEWTRDERELFFVQFTGDPVNAFRPVRVSDTGADLRGLLAPGTDYFLGTFAPDGSQLAYYLTNSLMAVNLGQDSQSRTTLVTSTIRTVAAGIGQLTELNGIEWANTGRLLFDREAGTASPVDVFTVLASGGFPPQALGPRRRDPPADTGAALNGRFQSPTFSPDFSRAAFSLETGSGTDAAGIYLADVDGENARMISTEPGRYLDWSVDGTRIYYVRELDDRPAVLKVPRALQ